jgi:sec-independent protein translocase protein TatC
MTILEELREFFKNILYWIYSLLGFSIFFFSFGLKEVFLFGRNYILPLPTSDSFSVEVFKKIQHDFLPPDVHLVVTNPTSAFVSQILLSLLLAFIVTLPVFLYGVIKYLTPALFKHEKKLILQSLLPSVALFLGGCAFAYFFLIPATFKILYPYAFVINATPFFSVSEFVSSVLGLMIATGLMFLLPVLMGMLSFLGFVDSSFWRSHFRHALLFFLIFTAIITPDGTGVTMAILFFPLIGLYSAGIMLTSRKDRSKI